MKGGGKRSSGLTGAGQSLERTVAGWRGGIAQRMFGKPTSEKALKTIAEIIYFEPGFSTVKRLTGLFRKKNMGPRVQR